METLQLMDALSDFTERKKVRHFTGKHLGKEDLYTQPYADIPNKKK